MGTSFSISINFEICAVLYLLQTSKHFAQTVCRYSLNMSTGLTNVPSTLDYRGKEGDLTIGAIVSEGQEVWKETGDFSSDVKPGNIRFPSYTEMIATVILSDTSKSKTLQDIYALMTERYTFLQQRGRSWKNSVRHTLSFNECFLKLPRIDSGQRCNWTIHPKYLYCFSMGNFKTSKTLLRKRRRNAEKHILEYPQANQTLLHQMNDQNEKRCGFQQHYNHPSLCHNFQCVFPNSQLEGQLPRTNNPQQTVQYQQNPLRHYPNYFPPNFDCFSGERHDSSFNHELQSEHYRVFTDFSKFCIKLLNEQLYGGC